MPIPAATQHADDEEMDYAVIFENIDGYRAWLNEVDTADFATAAVEQEHIVRPVLMGKPTESQVGQRELVAWRTNACAGPPPFSIVQWAGNRDRLQVNPFVQPAGLVWRLPLGWTLYMPEDAEVEVAGTLEWQVRCAQGLGGFIRVYPTSEGVGETAFRGGHFALFLVNRATGEEEELPATQMHVYPQFAVGSQHDSGAFIWADDLLAGEYDVFIGYVDVGGKGLFQVDVGAFSGNLEAHM